MIYCGLRLANAAACFPSGRPLEFHMRLFEPGRSLGDVIVSGRMQGMCHSQNMNHRHRRAERCPAAAPESHPPTWHSCGR